MKALNKFLKIKYIIAVNFFIFFPTVLFAEDHQLNTLHHFNNYESSAVNSNYHVILNKDENIIYGTSALGSNKNNQEGYGAIFSIHPLSTALHPAYTVLYAFTQEDANNHLFNPDKKITLANDGKSFYSMTGDFDGGTVYQFIFPTTNTKGKIKVLQIFSLNDAASPMDPVGKLILTNDSRYLYGITESGNGVRSRSGYLYRIDTTKMLNKGLTILHDFGLSHGGPAAIVITKDNKTIYGTTVYGGDKNCGTVFRFSLEDLNPATNYKTIANFACSGFSDEPQPVPSSLVLSQDESTLYGATEYGSESSTTYFNGYIFKLSVGANHADINIIHNITPHEGAHPEVTALSNDGSMLYGTTFGLNENSGIVFSLNTTNNDKTITPLYIFDDRKKNSGETPRELTINKANNLLFGATLIGSDNDGGTIFSLTTK